MHTISDTVNRKIIDQVDISNLEIETDTGWYPISKIIKTAPYQVWELHTESGMWLECADDHIVFDDNFNEIFVKDIRRGTYIQTIVGRDMVTCVQVLDRVENMFDVTVDSSDHRYFTSGILSHNTTICNALSYAWHGVALTNIKKDNLINKINSKNMLVSLTFSKDDERFRIERGRRPAVFNFVNLSDASKNQTSDSQGEARDTQKDINDLLGMSHDMFKHILALNTYSEPFLSMKAADQRAIIEQLLGITLLSEKSDALSKEIKKTKETIFQETAHIDATQKANERIQHSIDTLVMSQRTWNLKHNTSLEQIAKQIIELEGLDIQNEIQLHSDIKKYDELSTKLKSLNKEKTTLDSAVLHSGKTRDKYVIEMAALESKTCPACEQELHDHKHDTMLELVKGHLVESQSYYDKVTGEWTLVSKQLADIGTIGTRAVTYYPSIEEALTHQNNMISLTAQLNSKILDVNPYDDQIIELKSEALQELNWDVVTTLTKLKDHQEFLQKLLSNKDSFIRKKIIDQNLTFLNTRLTYYLDKMGLPHTVIFQNDLSVEITQLGQDLDFDNLSRGERNRLILGLSWAFRDVWESLYHSVNLLFIDELIDNGLDANGVENALSVLKKIGRERDKNIFLISHKDELVGRVNNVLKVVKENGFTGYQTPESIT